MRFYPLTLDEILQVVNPPQKRKPKRKITAVHLHHTITPRRDDFSGVADLESIAGRAPSGHLPQHLTIDGSGLVWTGRHWDLPPASIANLNGTAAAGPFSIALAGDFNQEVFDGIQRSTAIALVAGILRSSQLDESDIVFHSEAGAGLDCPGSNIDAGAFRADVAVALARPLPPVAPRRVTGPFSPEYSAAAALQEDLGKPPKNMKEPQDADASEALVRNVVALAAGPSSRAMARGEKRKLTAETMVELLPHVVNLTQGLLSDEGKFKTRLHHLDEMFTASIPKYIADCKAEGRTPRIVFFAHGGLNSETAGLEGALNQLEWWTRNKIYPVFFVWETGLLSTIHFLLRPKDGTRNFFSDRISDPLIEKTVHAIGGVSIWGNMKQSAERAAVHPEGGSKKVAERLVKLMTAEPDLEVHAIGHSAGAIFHAHFIEALGNPAHKAPRDLTTVQLFAPAIRTDEFKTRVIPRVGKGNGIASMAMYTMRASLEEDDNCITIYRKSLLCLIRAGLEPKRNTPILGLEDSLGEDGQLRAFFGLDGGGQAKADVVFSISPANAPVQRRSTAKAHGAFDNNIETMNSAASRILGSRDMAGLISFATSSAAERTFGFDDPLLELPEDVRAFLSRSEAQTVVLSSPSIQILPQPSPLVGQPGNTRRRALCVGINDYGSQSLQFCIADAEMWAEALRQQGFATKLLTDRQASRDGILDELRGLVRDAVAGDTIVFQFAGHGTTAIDVNGDEAKGRPDFAYVPHDFDSGPLVLDDDVFAIWRELKQGVTAYSFIDACHSGEGLRAFIDGDQSLVARRARFLNLTPEQQRRHIDFRRSRGLRSADAVEIAGTAIFFGACSQEQVALEQEGHGDFTRRAAPEIANATLLTNSSFHRRVLDAFGSLRQTPQWDAAPGPRKDEIGGLPLLQPVMPQQQIGVAGGRALAMTTRPGWRRNVTPPQTVTV
jgi:hypothetical protein